MADTFTARLLARLGRTLEPLFRPNAAWERDRLETILAEQREALAVLRKQSAKQVDEVARSSLELERLRTETHADLGSVRKNIVGLRARVERELQFGERVLRRSIDRGVEFHEERVLDRLARIARSGRPVLVGPWTGEVGFELIYWVPFVRWALTAYGIDPARVIVCSRGGAQPWYDALATQYVDALDLSSADEFRERTAPNRKQRGLWGYDRDLVRRTSRRLGVGPMAIIHPLLMYGLYYPYWRGDAPFARVREYARFRRYAPIDLPRLETPLPARYTAVRFYFSDCFPDTPANRAFVAQTLRGLAARGDVVMLQAGVGLDDHEDASTGDRHRIHVVDAGRSPKENLAIQTAVIGRADAFVGTYGGFSYLAPLYGVPTVAFYSVRNFQATHLHAAQLELTDIDGGRLSPVDVADAALMHAALGGLTSVRSAGAPS